ncbi:hypothetical protein ABIE65_001757 [Constrictibacter sp. MBR-5]|jgi:hypothetical protein
MTANLWVAVQQAVEQHEIDALIAGWLSARLDNDRRQRVETDFAAAFAAHTGMSRHAAAAYVIGSDAEAQLPQWQRESAKATGLQSHSQRSRCTSASIGG